jgi:hypothetical protein
MADLLVVYGGLFDAPNSVGRASPYAGASGKAAQDQAVKLRVLRVIFITRQFLPGQAA